MKRLIRIGLGLLMAAAGEATAQQYVISTVAGGAPPPHLPPTTPVAALTASVGTVRDVTTSKAGNLYLSTSLGCVFAVDREGILTRVAGTCRAGDSGDGGLATNARLAASGLAVDSAGNLYIADGGASIRKVTPDGIITTVAGDGNPGYSGDGGPATSARLCAGYFFDVSADSSRNLYIADGCNHRVRKVTPDGIITTIAGDGNPGYSGDGGPATSAQLLNPSGVAVDSADHLYIADLGNGRIRKISPRGIITTVAGNGNQFYFGDGPATSTGLSPAGVAVDSVGNLFIADWPGYIRKVSLDGMITTIPELRLSKSASYGVGRVAVSATDDVYYVADTCQVRRISPAGDITAVVGQDGCFPSGDGGPATAALIFPAGVAVDSAGNLYIADVGHHRVRKVSPDGVITTAAGNGVYGYSGDGGAATSAELRSPTAVAVDAAGNLYIADNLAVSVLAESESRVRKVTPDGIITTVVGCDRCYNGFVTAVAADSGGNLYVTDIVDEFVYSCHVYKVAPDGFLTTIVASSCGYSGDGGPAVSAPIGLGMSSGIAVDSTGNLYIGEYIIGAYEYKYNRVRKVTPDGIITTIAGNGTAGYSGDGGPATNAQLSPAGVAVDAADNLFIADIGNHRVRKVTPDGIITTIAGDGKPGYSGDGGPATSAQLHSPTGVAVDSAGNVYVVDSDNREIRMLHPVAKETVSGK